MILPDLDCAEQLVPVNQLLGPEGPSIISAAVGNGVVERLRPTQVRYRPDASITVTYRATIDLGEHTWEGLLVAHSGNPTPDVPTVVSDGDMTVAVWKFPDDPGLPGLRTVLDGIGVRQVLSQIGVDVSTLRVHTRSYRPLRRAVVEAVTPEGSAFIKVTRPEAVRSIHEAHVALERSLPIPPSLGWSAELGVVVLGTVPGNGLRDQIRAGETDLPGATELVALLDRFPEEVDPGRSPARGPRAEAPGHARLLARILPEVSDRVHAIAQTVQGHDEADVRMVHGDFHAAQMLVRSGHISGLVDIDGAGPGARADDLATMIGNLSVIATLGAPDSAWDYLGGLCAGLSRVCDPGDLAKRAAAAVLGYATGPFRTCNPTWPEAVGLLVGLAEMWLDVAGDAPFTGPRHPSP